MTYWHESEDAKRDQAARDAIGATRPANHKPHPLMPCIFGPDNTPEPAPREPLERVRALLALPPASAPATPPVEPVAGDCCAHPWCGVDGKTCLDPNCAKAAGRRRRVST